jgi:hypothetical protein
MNIDPAAPRSLITRLDRCFDDELSIEAGRFDTTTTLFELTDESSDLSIEGHEIWLAPHHIDIETYLSPFTERTSAKLYTFYWHLHDNVVRVLALLEAFDEQTFLKRPKLFKTQPAVEGGTNVLGVCDVKCHNLLSVQWDQADTLRIEMAKRDPKTDA